MIRFTTNLWVKIVLGNLTTVAFLGLIMRYKIEFELPFLDQKHLQLSHSHFAFAGWITQTLYVLMVDLMTPYLSNKQIKQYNFTLWSNLFCAYGMLISFLVQGYGHASIGFSTASVIITFLFSILFFRHSIQFKIFAPAIKWFKAALTFAMLSSAGTAVLAYMMLNHHIHQNAYLSSVYFYLHFQYNGWFFFACVALFISQASLKGIIIEKEKNIFMLLFFSCLPAYFLSTLWANIPVWLYIIVVIASIAQFIGWIILVKCIFKTLQVSISASKLISFLSYFVVIAGTIKFFLQLGSTIPFVSTLAFGFRPIVIAYLHLVLLAIISTSIILYLFSTKLISNSRLSSIGILFFAIGVLLNESVLALVGIASFDYIVIPYTNIMLLIVAFLLFSATILMFTGQFRKVKS